MFLRRRALKRQEKNHVRCQLFFIFVSYTPDHKLLQLLKAIMYKKANVTSQHWNDWIVLSASRNIVAPKHTDYFGK